MNAKRPNILYFVVHDLGRYLPMYGAKVSTPHLSHFASEGVVFTNCFCASAACSPSRGCAMTGRYAHSNGLMGLVNFDWDLPRAERTIVDHLNDAGYDTVLAGFQHERHDDHANRYRRVLGTDDEAQRKLAENVVDCAVEYLAERARGDAPFYLNVGTQEVHASLWMGGGGYGPLRRPERRYGLDRPEWVELPPHLPDYPVTRDTMRRFVPCIRYMDHQFGRLMEAVDRLGYRDNTLVVFTTDHGIVGSRAKATMYDPGIEIATLMRFPGVLAAGAREAALVSNVDFVPTLLDAANVPTPAAVQGRSCWPRLTAGGQAPREAVFSELNWHERYDPIRSVRTARFHYLRNLDPEARQFLGPEDLLRHPDPRVREPFPNGLHFSQNPEDWTRFPRRPAEELYDTERDPVEVHNLAGEAAHADALARHRTLCDRWMEETNDPVLPGPIPRPPPRGH